MIAPFLVSVTDNGFKTVCQMKWVINITLRQSESIIPTTSERETLIESPLTSMTLVTLPPHVLGPKYE